MASPRRQLFDHPAVLKELAIAIHLKDLHPPDMVENPLEQCWHAGHPQLQRVLPEGRPVKSAFGVQAKLAACFTPVASTGQMMRSRSWSSGLVSASSRRPGATE